jgi:hypothetical protein
MDLEIHVLPFRFHSTNLDSSISSRNVHAIICPPRYFGNVVSYYLYYFLNGVRSSQGVLAVMSSTRYCSLFSMESSTGWCSMDATLLLLCELGGLAPTLAVDAPTCLCASYATCSRSNLSLFEDISSSKLRNFSSASRLIQSHFL